MIKALFFSTAFFVVFFLFFYCRGIIFPKNSCQSCHEKIAIPSLSHKDLSCKDCHGGDPFASDKNKAHANMYGPKNPSDPKFWDKTCGKCHIYQIKRVRSSLMYTNLGIIRKIFLAWDNPISAIYGTSKEKNFSKNGRRITINPIKELNHISADLYRKFCSRCHINLAEYRKYNAVHGSGCAACHFPYNETATYKGKDKNLFNKWPYSAYHRIILPSTNRCLSCHNRSARIGLSYVGLCELNNSMVSTSNGKPGPMMISGGRNVVFVNKDVHFKAGMDCIDCHTSRDIMGDGYVYLNKEEQVEIRCWDCHGTGNNPPTTQVVKRENHPSIRESKNYPKHIKLGTNVVLTSKKRPFSNVFKRDKKIYVIGKISGKIFEAPIITNTKEHTIYGHKRLACYSCHSSYVQQCYGCHTSYDLRYRSKDYIKDKLTPGRFREKEDYRYLFPFPLAIDHRNMIVPVTPGCQTFLTVIGKNGELIKKEHITKYKGKPVLRFAPVVPHTTQKKGLGCRTCHTNPFFLGFGNTIVQNKTFIPLFLCEKDKNKPLDGYLIYKNSYLKTVSVIIGNGARPFNQKEIKRIFSVAKCLICHNDPNDPIYQKKLDFSRINSCLYEPYIHPYRKKR